MQTAGREATIARVADAFVWGLPLLLTRRTRAAQLAGGGGPRLVARDRLSTAADRAVVAPNNDTLHASGWFDLACAATPTARWPSRWAPPRRPRAPPTLVSSAGR